MCPGYDDLVRRLDEAVALADPERITDRVKADLCDILSRGALVLPERFHHARPDCYARRLLHHDPARGYTAVVMTWGPGQQTPLHDHGGLWCVEGVVQGTIEVTQYDLDAASDDGCVFRTRGQIRTGVGSAGSLIPPSDYHVLANSSPSDTSITLHVYGGDLAHCEIFLPRPDGTYERQARTLSYHD